MKKLILIFLLLLTSPALALDIQGGLMFNGLLLNGTCLSFDAATGSGDVFLCRDAANTLALKNGTTAQELRIYGTTTGSKYLILKHDGTDAYLSASSGQILYVDLTNVFRIKINSNIRAEFGQGYFGPGSNGGITLGSGDTGFGALFLDYTNTATIGAVTINKASGRVRIAAAGTSVVVTNSLVTAATHVFAVASTADATARVTSVVPAAGSFTINTVAVTAETTFDFLVISSD